MNAEIAIITETIAESAYSIVNASDSGSLSLGVNVAIIILASGLGSLW
jgi:hypothetical protein